MLPMFRCDGVRVEGESEQSLKHIMSGGGRREVMTSPCQEHELYKVFRRRLLLRCSIVRPSLDKVILDVLFETGSCSVHVVHGKAATADLGCFFLHCDIAHFCPTNERSEPLQLVALWEGDFIFCFVQVLGGVGPEGNDKVGLNDHEIRALSDRRTID